MKYRSTIPADGSLRRRVCFAWLPVPGNGVWHWLERYVLVERYSNNGPHGYQRWWSAVRVEPYRANHNGNKESK